MWPFWWFGRGIFLLLLIVVIAFLIRRPPVFPVRMPAGPPGPPIESAEDVLKKRYALGEISKEEYESKLADIRR